MARQYTIDGKTYWGDPVTRQVSASGTWAASSSLTDIQFDKDILITNIRLQAHMTVTLAATALIDGPKRSLQALKLVGDSKTFLGLGGGAAANQMGVLLALLNEFDTQGKSLGANSDVGATVLDQMYHFHPGIVNPRDSFDLSCVIPARALSNLVAQIQTPAAAVIDSGANITAGTYSFEIDGVAGIPAGKGMYYPGAYVQAVPHSTAFTALPGLEIDIPTGGYLKRIGMLMHDNTAVAALRSDAQVTAAQIRVTADSKTIIQQNMLGMKYRNSMRYGVIGDDQPTVLGAIATTRPGYNGGAHMPIGFAILDLRDYFDPVLGLNLTTANQGFWKLGLLTAVATGTTFLYWDIVYPMAPEWVGK